MKIIKINEPKVIVDNPDSHHKYFGWPSIARLQNGKLAVVASGFRLRHVCPFGKTVISFSEDDGETYTRPAPVIDTPLDDRDGGILAYGKSNVMVTSFNNLVEMQRARKEATPFVHAYLDTVTPEEEERYYGTTYRVSHDCGVTFGPIRKAPVSSPHGPLEMPDGSILWVGRLGEDLREQMEDAIYACRIDPETGDSEMVGKIDALDQEDGITPISCEPHAILLDNGRLIAHIRVQTKHKNRMFTIYQSESDDSGKTWTKPHAILGRLDGAPPHLFRHSSGTLLCTYASREHPTSIRVMFSTDNGATWDINHELYVTPFATVIDPAKRADHQSSINSVAQDIGYPCTAEARDGSLLTVFYAHPDENSPAVVIQQKWRFEV
ncbi:MAG: exo-alpha-sialidase [Ruminococcaceae bacterium]|nr:exo-alpha-sialidase [Oscillospiraceae bacterium]